jgi:hypothetical protein
MGSNNLGKQVSFQKNSVSVSSQYKKDRVIWMEAITIFLVGRNATTIHVF